jgi:hypothetical protein
MLKTSQIAFLTILVLVADVWGQSQRNPKRGREGSQTQSQPKESQQAPTAEQRGTEQMPFAVKVIPTNESQEKAASDAKDREEKMELDRRLVNFNGDLAYYTKVLVGVAALQFLALILQAFFLSGTLKTARTTLRDLERAWLVSGPLHNTVAIIQNNITRVHLTATNDGRSRAIAKELAVVFFDQEPTAKVPNYKGAKIFKMELVIHPDNVMCAMPNWFHEYNGTNPFHCAGYLRYADVFGRLHTTRWCSIIDPQARTLETSGPLAWNEDD